MTSSGSARSSPGRRRTQAHDEISHRDLSRPIHASPMIHTLSRIEELEARTLYFGHDDASTQGTPAIVAEARAKR
jgi:hypothetical protein